ncbi:MAG: hypothetical protein ACE5IH_03915 [Thermodesulfobacteriota bacterium]
MKESEIFLKEVYEGLAEILKPYQKRQNQRQKMVDLIRQCIRYTEKDDFLGLDELLKNKIVSDIESEPGLRDTKEIFDRLGTYAGEKVDCYRIEFIDDMIAHAKEADLPIEIDFPRFSVLKGIEGSFDFNARSTIINKKTIKSINPKKIIAAVLKVKRQLYDRPYDPENFIDGLYQTYCTILKREKKSSGHAVPMQRFYLEYVLSLQSKAFFQNMDKGKFRGYSMDQFAVDIWRYSQAGTGGALGRFAMQLRPGRNNALWLIDSDGERRQITTISFQENKS